MTTHASRRAVLYLRLSDTTENSTSIVRQEADLRALADREGWEVVAVFTDDGVSGGKRRDKAEASLAMLRDNEADVLAVWKLDRFGRRGIKDVAAIVEALETRESSARPALFVSLSDGLRSDVAMWETIASLYAGQAKQERLNTITRVKSSRAHLAKVGRFPGGVVPFGYTPAPHPDGDGRILRPYGPEADLVRAVADRLLDGASVFSIVRWLNDEGVPSSRSAFRRARMAGRPTDGLDRGHWTSFTVQLVWTSDTLLGRFMREGSLVTDDHGLPAQLWEPVLDHATLARLRDRVPNPRINRGVKTIRPKQARLLSGVVSCAHCGGPMYANSYDKPVYKCSGRLDTSCPMPGIRALAIEEYVTERFLTLVGDLPEYHEVETVGHPEVLEELSAIEHALADASAAIIAPGADTAALVARINDLNDRASILRATPSHVEVHSVPTGRTYREAWDAEEDLGARRALLTANLLAVTVSRLPPGASRKSSTPDRRVAIHWLEVAGDAGGESRSIPERLRV